jgi:hypothetical protein
MTTHNKTIRLARLIGLEHKTVDARVVATRAVARTDGSVEWRWYPWRPYECEADLEPIKAWLKIHYPKWPRTTGCDGEREHCEAFCDAVLAAFDKQHEPNAPAEHNDAMRDSIGTHSDAITSELLPYGTAAKNRRQCRRLSRLRCAAERRARRFDSTNTELGTLCDQLADGKHATELAESALAGERQEVEHLRGQLADAIERAEKTAAINDALRQRCHLAEDECDKLREALADADRNECCAAYKAQQLAEIERLTDRNESLLAQVQRYSISESRLLDKIEEIAAGDTSEGAELQQLRQFRDSILANIHEHAGNAVQPFAWIDQRKFDVIKAALAAERVEG